MAHQRKSELNRSVQEGVNPEIPWGVPSDDLHPDGEPHPDATPPGAPEAGSLSKKTDREDRKSVKNSNRARSKTKKTA